MIEASNITNFFTVYFAWYLTLIGILGLCIGSFLNVVIYRIPLMLKQSWRSQCLEYLEMHTEPKPEIFNLLRPRSICPHCKLPISAWQNIPLISFLILRARCANCGKRISWRYPLVEFLTAVISIVVANHFGVSVETLAGLIFTWTLIALVFIDFDHQLLPDDVTLSLLWLGLLFSLTGIFTDPQSAIIGCIAGYVSLWVIAKLFKLVRGIEGMGYGDFKLFACLGAWLGWQMLPFILLVSTLLGAAMGIYLILFKQKSRTSAIPFGPYLAIAGWIALLYGNVIIQLYLALLSSNSHYLY